MSVLDKVRKWIDGESAELVLEEAARNAQIKPRSHSEEFIVKIARAVEEVMQREMVPLPQGTTIIPTEYIIFMSGEDDKEWQGVKRKGLEQGLYHILAERAREISGKKKLETKTFVVELRVDGTLEKNEIRVQHSWEDSSANKTSVLSKPKPQIKAEPQINNFDQTQPVPPVTQPLQAVAYDNAPPTSPNFAQPFGQNQASQTSPAFNVSQAIPLPTEGEEMTHVKRRVPALYRLEVWHSGVRQNVMPIYQKEISVGRGSKSKPVDVPLSGDPEISRRHLTISTDGAGNFWVTNEGRNPTMINNYELPSGQRVSVAHGQPIAVCSFLLRVQPA